MDSAQNPVPVGLLYQASSLPDHLKQALTDVGILVALEARYAELQAEDITRLKLRAVIINLDAEDDDELLDQVSDQLDGAGCELIFNDALASGDLSGWDQARWARHLASKISGVSEIHPPRPAGAEAIPRRGAAGAGEPAVPAVVATPAPAPEPEPEPRIGEPEPAAAAPSHVNVEPVSAAEPHHQQEPVAAAPPVDTREDVEQADTEAALNLGDFTGFLDDVPSGIELAAANSGTAEHPLVEDLEDAGGLDSLLDSIPDGLDLAVEDDGPVNFSSYDNDLSVDGEGDAALDDDAAELAAQLEASLASADDGAAQVWDGDFGSTEEQLQAELDEPDVAAPVHGLEMAPEPKAAPAAVDKPKPSGLSLSLAPLDEDDEESPAVSAPAVTSGASYDFSGLSMELEEVASPEEEARSETPDHESWLEAPTSVARPGDLRSVWVLGASIGGPEAIREFLAVFPAGHKAVFVLAQHMGAEFQELMTAQLDKATPLRVRLAADGDAAQPGDVLVVPVGKRFTLRKDGAVRLDDELGESAYNPSIDNVICGIADTFGKSSGAIIFSGMARDAIDGCAHMRSKGGAVWVQDPASCVISSMIDGVRERQLESFMGSPQQLAEKFLSEFAS